MIDPPRHVSHYIDGCWTDAESHEMIPVVDPATEAELVRVPRATPKEADRAVRSARAAFDEGSWPQMPPRKRRAIIRDLADGLRRRRDRIAATVIAQGGCTERQTHGLQVDLAIDMLDRCAELTADDPVESVVVAGGPFGGTADGLGTTLVVREPIGVVAAITPFNFPFFLNAIKVGAALATGCTVVLKPTEYICLDALHIAEVLDEETDLPSGAFNLLLGAGGDVGEVLASHPMVDHVSFTGSTDTGRRVMGSAAQTIKRLTLELGGKSANVIFGDADLDRALAGDGALVISHCGQGCAQWTRVVVEDAIHDAVVERMIRRAQTVVIGDPAHPATELGPLVSRAQWERVSGYIRLGIEEGATLAYGGSRPPEFDRGFYMAPTIFTDVRNHMRIAQEEIFGPVVTVQRFRDEEEAIRIANDSIFGLNGAVWSGDLARGLRVASRIRTGVINVNGRGDGGLDYPNGGFKQSGLGREFGVWGVREYTELKAIRYNAL
ncbi:MAG TPA: aldehyde dehydrogenase family protein [Solirubrobacteraceae bacterium]|nr:aldehyde dehydrogenase family protein [Solirubrobacteraceae bacterium]